ncbi:MAG: hypothetical protein M1829_001232 [Trizodia sp. TS-e1964]|nr:MAG: hypothetical protein M1829_001232 [Trizodia sp. TS-e1964]
MGINWNEKDSFARLLAAVLAAHPEVKLNYRAIASMYGQGATYDAVEGRFRIIKKDAKVLRAEIDEGVRDPAPARGTPRKNKNTPGTDSQHSTITGRVTKAKAAPRAKKSAALIKVENLFNPAPLDTNIPDSSAAGSHSATTVESIEEHQKWGKELLTLDDESRLFDDEEI